MCKAWQSVSGGLAFTPTFGNFQSQSWRLRALVSPSLREAVPLEGASASVYKPRYPCVRAASTHWRSVLAPGWALTCPRHNTRCHSHPATRCSGSPGPTVSPPTLPRHSLHSTADGPPCPLRPLLTDPLTAQCRPVPAGSPQAMRSCSLPALGS